MSEERKMVEIPADRITRLLDMVDEKCVTAIGNENERDYELWTAIRDDLLKAQAQDESAV